MLSDKGIRAYITNKNNEARQRLIAKSGIMFKAHKYAQKYSRNRWCGYYCNPPRAIKFLNFQEKDFCKIEARIINDFKGIYKSVATELDEIYAAIREVYDRRNTFKKSNKQPWVYGQPQYTPEAIEGFHKEFLDTNKEVFSEINSVTSIQELEPHQALLDQAVELAEKAIGDMLKSLTQHMNVVRQKLQDRLAILNLILGSLKTTISAGSGGG